MPKNQKQTQPVRNGTAFSDLFQDVFGLEAWAEQKKTPNARRAVPWQWVIWGGLIFFCLGWGISHSANSFWILVVAVAAAVIVFLARSTETVEPQVFLLTDNRTEEQKKAYRNQIPKKPAPRKRPARRPQAANQVAKTEAQTQVKVAETAPQQAVKAEEATPEKATATAKPKRQPRKKPAPKATAKTAPKATTKAAPKSTPKATPKAATKAAPKAVAEVKEPVVLTPVATEAKPTEPKAMPAAKKPATTKPKAPRARKPRTTVANKAPRMTKAAKPAAPEAPVTPAEN